MPVSMPPATDGVVTSPQDGDKRTKALNVQNETADHEKVLKLEQI
jgi:hypothetical protein